jgi:hypothetical protein
MAKAKTKRTQNVSRATMDKQVGSLILEVGTIIIVIDNHMAVIQV